MAVGLILSVDTANGIVAPALAYQFAARPDVTLTCNIGVDSPKQILLSPKDNGGAMTGQSHLGALIRNWSLEHTLSILLKNTDTSSVDGMFFINIVSEVPGIISPAELVIVYPFATKVTS